MSYDITQVDLPGVDQAAARYQQNQLAQIAAKQQIAATQQQQQQQSGLASYVNGLAPGQTVDPLAAYKAGGSQGIALSKSMTDATASTANAQLAQNKLTFDHYDQLDRTISGIKALPAEQRNAAYQQQLETLPPQDRQSLPPAWDETIADKMHAMAIDGKTRAAEAEKQTEMQQRATQFAQSQATARRGQNITMRGQDMTDARDKTKDNPMGIGAGPNAPTTSGDAFLQTLPQTQAAQVKALAEGRMQFPGGFALKSPYWQQMISAVAQYDPTFDAVNYNARSKTRNDFTSGKSAQNIRAIETALGHAGHLGDMAAGTASTSSPALNSVENWVKTQTGDQGPNNYNQTALALANELETAFHGSNGAEGAVKALRDTLSSNASAEQKQGAIHNAVSLLSSRLEPLADQYNQGMGTSKSGIHMLQSPQAKAAYTKYGPAASQQTAAPQAAPQGLPANAKQAPDGNYYVPDPARPGKYLMVQH